MVEYLKDRNIAGGGYLLEEKGNIFKGALLSDSQTYREFIIKYKGKFSKGKYLKVDKNFEVIRKSPSFILELGYIYYRTGNKKIKEIISEEFLETNGEKVKRIERMSKLTVDEVEGGFRRALVNKSENHALKLGNELLHRDINRFFQILYNISLISGDENKLIKTFFMEEIVKDFQKGNKILNDFREETDEIIKNTICYFTRSDYEFIDFNNRNSIDYFKKNKADVLYKKIYIIKFDKIMERYKLKNIKKIKFEIDGNDGYNRLSESKKKLYDYITV